MIVSLTRSGTVGRTAPQVEWRALHRMADTAHAAVLGQVIKALQTGQTNWDLVAQRLRGTSPHSANNVIDTVGIGHTLMESVWPLLQSLFVRAGTYASPVKTVVKAKTAPKGSFNVNNPSAVTWAQQQAAKLVSGVTKQTQEAIASVIEESMRLGRPIAETTRLLQAVVGLTDRQALSISRLQESLAAAGKSTTFIDRALQSAQQTALRARAETITRTETLDAVNSGQREAWLEADRAGLLDADLVMEWIASDDACDECASLDGEQAELDGEFSDDGDDGPPLHPNCECALGLASRRD